jgi:large subunit ribosomal protein L24
MGLKIKKGDQIMVIAGRDRGKHGKVIQTIPADRTVIVDGVNVVTKHQRPRAATRATPATQTGIIKKPAPLDISKVALICPRCDKPSRVGHELEPSGEKIRICKRCGSPVDAS